MNLLFKHELADMYGISRKTLINRIKQIPDLHKKLEATGFDDARKLTGFQQNAIFAEFGDPRKKRKQKSVPVKSYYRHELVKFYGIDYRTFLSKLMEVLPPDDYDDIFSKLDWGTEIRTETPFHFSARQVEKIFFYLGTPKL